MEFGDIEWYFYCIQKAATEARAQAALMYEPDCVDLIDAAAREIAKRKYLAMIGPMDPWPKQLRRGA